ncbi:MAG: GGDEF domain-containing protein, partial [Planctomycetota bacterium]
LQMADERGKRIPESDCPVLGALRSGVQSLRRLTICGRNNRSVAVDTHSIPVLAEDGTTLGAILLLHDATSETSLEQRCQRLYEKATRDPLTQLANRAEFDRVHEMFVAAHRQQQVPCSLIMCDLDRFKQVNDNYGHQAGDEAIKTLASVLKSSCRPGDLVARYGGEEFVVLCADCDNAVAARRAEQIRKALSQLPQQSMGGASVTASFGVTEIQPGDTPETMLRRADRALLLAKSRGRNMVVQLGSGLMPDEEDADDDSRRRRFWPLGGSGRKEVSRQTLVTPVPLRVAVEKLRGFVADHQARIALIEGNCLRLEIEERTRGALRRFTDRPVVFSLALTLEEDRADNLVRTRVHVALTPRTNRERRRDEVSRRARQVLLSLRSYLMASDDSVHESSALARARRFLAPWLENR